MMAEDPGEKNEQLKKFRVHLRHINAFAEESDFPKGKQRTGGRFSRMGGSRIGQGCFWGGARAVGGNNRCLRGGYTSGGRAYTDAREGGRGRREDVGLSRT